MKNPALILSSLTLALTLFSCTHKKKIKNDLEALHYKGKVKSISYNVYRAVEKTAGKDSGKIENGNLISKVESQCNTLGYFVEQTTYKNDKLYYKVDRRYDSLGNTIEETEYKQAVIYLAPNNAKSDSISVTHITYVYKYDDKGNKIEMKAMQDGKQWFRDENIFDKRGNLIHMEEFIPWDTLNKKEDYKYDKHDNLIEKTGWLPDGSMFFKFSYTCNDIGEITALTSYKNDGTVDANETMKYDQNGNKIADSKVLTDGGKGFQWRYEFKEFDKAGNWIKEISYSNNKPQAITERQIEYYK